MSDKLCTCKHPQGWHYKGEGGCIECLCAKYNDDDNKQFIEILIEEWLKLAEKRDGFPCIFCDGNIHAVQVNSESKMLGHSNPVCGMFKNMMSNAIPRPRDIKA